MSLKQPSDYYGCLPSPKRHALTVRDVERLATAGVKIDFEQIATQIMPDPLPPPDFTITSPMTGSFWQRWKRAHPDHEWRGKFLPYHIFATEQHDKVNLYVAPINGKDPFILTDEAALFPSDALMAKLALWEQTP